MEIAIQAPDLVGRLQERLLAEFADAVEQWSAIAPALTRWEDDHLLDHPTPELLADHKASLQRMIAFGKLIASATEQADFPDRRTAEMVEATLTILRDKLRMWHGERMSKEESERILAGCFPNES